jgi:hypothetical protein
MSVPGPEIHHIGHPTQSGLTCCGIPMPAEQSEVRARAEVTVCEECVKRYQRERNAPTAR